MAFFIGLVMMYALIWIVSFLPFAGALRGMEGIVTSFLMFTFVGLSHFLKPEKLLAMIPQNWPYREVMNYISGGAEMLLGLAFLFSVSRVPAGWGLILLLLAVFPANIHVAISKPDLYNISRLFFQPVYIFWIYWFCISGKQLAGLV